MGSTAKRTPSLLAAVDLGSNSFHMVIAREVRGELQVVDRLKERVQLAAGLTEAGMLDEASQERAFATLERFGQRLRGVAPERIRAVGTSALRQARNARPFLREAEERLGHRIEIVSGQEEARLIHAGVAHTIASSRTRHLVIDIGGGSTECIIGRGFEAELCESISMGCVSFSLRFFGDGELSAVRFDKAVLAAKREMLAARHRLLEQGWRSEVGSSGSIGAIDEVVRANGWAASGITLASLQKLRAALEAAGRTDRLSMKGLKSDRHPIFAGGVAILIALFESLGIKRLQYTQAAMREGLLYEQMGRLRHDDIRDFTIRRMSEQYHVDEVQAGRVERLAGFLRDQLEGAWSLEGEEASELLAWSARLHEVGLSISHSGYHKHGGYLVEHSEMPGFSRDEQGALAQLIRSHRKSLADKSFEAHSREEAELLRRLSVLLRLAVLLHRERAEEPVVLAGARARGKTLTLTFEPGWLAAHPLTLADLEGEREELRAIGVKLVFT